MRSPLPSRPPDQLSTTCSRPKWRGSALHRPRTRQQPKAGGIESYTKVRVSGCDKSGRWARRAGTSKITTHLPYSHRARRVAPLLHALFGCYLPPCEEVRQPAERELLKENCGTVAMRHLNPLKSAIGRLLLRGPMFTYPSVGLLMDTYVR
jgi:hypothetical protein